MILDVSFPELLNTMSCLMQLTMMATACHGDNAGGGLLKGLNLQGSKISLELGKWLEDKATWDWYATLTFRDPQNPRYPNWTKIGWKFAHNALENLNSALIRLEDSQNPVWVAVMELQQRGVPHWHALVANVVGERRMGWVDWWYKHYGIARVLPYDQELGARYYLGKYLTKEVADIRFSPAFDALVKRQLIKRG